MNRDQMHSLKMKVEKVGEAFIISAPWLEGPVSAKTFEEAYDKAIRLRWKRRIR